MDYYYRITKYRLSIIIYIYTFCPPTATNRNVCAYIILYARVIIIIRRQYAHTVRVRSKKGFSRIIVSTVLQPRYYIYVASHRIKSYTYITQLYIRSCQQTWLWRTYIIYRVVIIIIIVYIYIYTILYLYSAFIIVYVCLHANSRNVYFFCNIVLFFFPPRRSSITK